MWHVFSWTKTTRRNVKAFGPSKMTTFTFCSTFSRHFGWIWQRHCSQRANAMRFHTNSDGFRHSRCMLNSTRHVVQWCIGMLPNTPRFRVATLFQKSTLICYSCYELFDCSKCCCTSSWLILNKKWRPCDTRDTRNEAAIATLPYFALYQSARTREDWETVIDKDCAPLSIGGICGRISQKK